MAKPKSTDVAVDVQNESELQTALDQQATQETKVLELATDPRDSSVEPPVSEEEMVECAVLLDCIYGKHDDIISLTQSEAKSAQAGGYVDTHPNAIKAIRGL